MIRFFIFIWILIYATGVIAQDTLRVKTIENKHQQNASRETFENLQQKYEQKNNFVKRIYYMIFRPVTTSAENSSTKVIEKKLRRDFNSYQGKIIRKINIRTLDPFGFSEQDSTKQPNKAERFGNLFHNATKTVAVKKFLLFKENSKLDSTLIKESERILRSQDYIRRVLITPTVTHSPDSVDINISVLDSWTIFFDGDASVKHVSGRVRENNFLGLGHQISVRYLQEIVNPYRAGFSTTYNMPNISNTNINTYFGYSVNFDKYYERMWSVYRNYFSVYARWAGGLQFYERTFEDGIVHNDSIYMRDFKTRIIDAWGSTSFPIAKKSTKNDVTNLILSLRFRYTDYLQSPEYELDRLNFFSRRKLVLSSIGMSNIGYEQDRYIFRHEDIEDVPVGKTLSVLSGFEDNLGQLRTYLGLKSMYGSYFPFGYLSADFQLGSFFNKDKYSQTTLRFEMIYFTKLFRLGRWNFRQFAKISSVIGYNRKDYVKDRITLNGSSGLYGFNSPTLTGTRKMILSLQTQSYSPISWAGFRISPFFTNEWGFIGQEGNSFFKDQVFPKFSIGFNITNDYVLFGNFQFSFFYIPRIPGNTPRHDFSGTRNDDFRLPNFNFRAPEVVNFR